MTGYLRITMYTSTNPTSCSFTFQLYDKYKSSTDYSRTVYSTQSYSRNVGGYNVIGQVTSISFRKPVYKDLRTS